MLLMSMIVNFGSHEAKSEFKIHIGFSFADIFSVALDFAKAAKLLHTTGSVTITAYQEGGDPT